MSRLDRSGNARRSASVIASVAPLVSRLIRLEFDVSHRRTSKRDDEDNGRQHDYVDGKHEQRRMPDVP
jgi:hypothetical protein